jgi:hypothetical protein
MILAGFPDLTCCSGFAKLFIIVMYCAEAGTAMMNSNKRVKEYFIQPQNTKI